MNCVICSNKMYLNPKRWQCYMDIVAISTVEEVIDLNNTMSGDRITKEGFKNRG